MNQKKKTEVIATKEANLKNEIRRNTINNDRTKQNESITLELFVQRFRRGPF